MIPIRTFISTSANGLLSKILSSLPIRNEARLAFSNPPKSLQRSATPDQALNTWTRTPAGPTIAEEGRSLQDIQQPISKSLVEPRPTLAASYLMACRSMLSRCTQWYRDTTNQVTLMRAKYGTSFGTFGSESENVKDQHIILTEDTSLESTKGKAKEVVQNLENLTGQKGAKFGKKAADSDKSLGSEGQGTNLGGKGKEQKKGIDLGQEGKISSGQGINQKEGIDSSKKSMAPGQSGIGSSSKEMGKKKDVNTEKNGMGSGQAGLKSEKKELGSKGLAQNKQMDSDKVKDSGQSEMSSGKKDPGSATKKEANTAGSILGKKESSLGSLGMNAQKNEKHSMDEGKGKDNLKADQNQRKPVEDKLKDTSNKSATSISNKESGSNNQDKLKETSSGVGKTLSDMYSKAKGKVEEALKGKGKTEKDASTLNANDPVKNDQKATIGSTKKGMGDKMQTDSTDQYSQLQGAPGSSNQPKEIGKNQKDSSADKAQQMQGASSSSIESGVGKKSSGSLNENTSQASAPRSSTGPEMNAKKPSGPTVADTTSQPSQGLQESEVESGTAIKKPDNLLVSNNTAQMQSTSGPSINGAAGKKSDPSLASDKSTKPGQTSSQSNQPSKSSKADQAGKGASPQKQDANQLSKSPGDKMGMSGSPKDQSSQSSQMGAGSNSTSPKSPKEDLAGTSDASAKKPENREKMDALALDTPEKPSTLTSGDLSTKKKDKSQAKEGASLSNESTMPNKPAGLDTPSKPDNAQKAGASGSDTPPKPDKAQKAGASGPGTPPKDEKAQKAGASGPDTPPKPDKAQKAGSSGPGTPPKPEKAQKAGASGPGTPPKPDEAQKTGLSGPGTPPKPGKSPESGASGPGSPFKAMESPSPNPPKPQGTATPQAGKNTQKATQDTQGTDKPKIVIEVNMPGSEQGKSPKAPTIR